MTKKIKVMSVFGTRPEAIKMAPLVLELEKNPQTESIVCVTAQHRQMLDQVMDAFHIKADYDLDIMEKNQTLSKITSKALLGLEAVIAEAQPDIVLVHGDTTTTFASALAAFYSKTDVGHVEAGLRTYDRYSPFPEEMNRVLTGRMARLHFAPTEANAQNLKREAIAQGVFVTGNTVIDALKYTVKDDYVFECAALNQQDFARKTILMTAHRRENYGKPFENIMAAVGQIAADNPQVDIIYPVHLSPYVQDMANSNLGQYPNVKLIEPLGVFDMHNLMKRVSFVITDSGGLQEEAPSLGKPVLVMRKETERPEAVTAGTVKVVGVEREDLYTNIRQLLFDQSAYDKMAQAVNPYGDGFASERIVKHIIETYEK